MGRLTVMRIKSFICTWDRRFTCCSVNMMSSIVFGTVQQGAATEMWFWVDCCKEIPINTKCYRNRKSIGGTEKASKGHTCRHDAE